MVILRMNEEMYAAKTFYNIGKGSQDVITDEENLQHLQDEILRQSLAAHCAEKFYDDCRKNHISIIDIEVEQAFILQVDDGSESQQAWMVAPLLDSGTMRKFSGTMEAGRNTDLTGCTCDALAHFSSYDSGGTAVLVDIQGITMTSDNARRRLVLFDLMFHSDGQGLGLGDAGVPGIKQFRAQHKCNKVCQALDLEPFMLADTAEQNTEVNDVEYTPPPSPDHEPLHPELKKIKIAAQAAQKIKDAAGRLTRSAAKMRDK
ncbi:hypothetical protein D9619_008626 [Psilocybe cf. subviscida]|uniref:Alpha-type protein kinase domain-containing protein n=1 Tax=Psilocybe cf. subviscida TaxID=2480587 RepID=A0A8H5BAM8_9AGAR|nr:hypothetical protein D9619_008626 [Psilocybe cf. subviscida]